MLRLQTVGPEDRNLLWTLLQAYLHEMTAYYPGETDARGDYRYTYFDVYFTEPARKAYFICNEDQIIGFAMLNPYSAINRTPDFTMAEFTILPAYRGRHYAREAVRMILSVHPGRWEIKFNEKNAAAKRLWTAAAAPYHPEVYQLSEQETVLAFACGGEES